MEKNKLYKIKWLRSIINHYTNKRVFLKVYDETSFIYINSAINQIKGIRLKAVKGNRLENLNS